MNRCGSCPQDRNIFVLIAARKIGKIPLNLLRIYYLGFHDNDASLSGCWCNIPPFQQATSRRRSEVERCILHGCEPNLTRHESKMIDDMHDWIWRHMILAFH